MEDNLKSLERSILTKIHSRAKSSRIENDSLPPAKYVQAIRKSGLAGWCARRGEEIPVPRLSRAKQQPFIPLVDKILAAKAVNSAADTRELEEKIDWLVYDLYGLSNEETAAVADSLWRGTLSEEEEDQALLRAMEEADVNDRVSLGEVLDVLRSADDC